MEQMLKGKNIREGKSKGKLSSPPSYLLKAIQNTPQNPKKQTVSSARKQASTRSQKNCRSNKLFLQNMKSREAKGALSADLLVCFPSRTNLKLMPKPVCSPARPLEPNKRHQYNQNHHHQPHHHHHHHQLVKKSSIGRSGLGQASPLLWDKTKPMGSEISEPTSPKVTCAGQIKVRHKSGSCKSWQSVMEEIERIHNNKKQRKRRRPGWAEALGFKKEVMQFLTCLRNIRFDLQCFGSFPRPDITSDEDEDEEEEEENKDYRENQVAGEGISDGADPSSSRAVFSKWFMVLQEDQSNGFCGEDKKERNDRSNLDDEVGSSSEIPVASVPPPNALLLMRCRSAPAKTWLEEKEEEEEDDEDEEVEEKLEENKNGLEKEEKKAKVTLKSLMEEDRQRKKTENLVVMAYDSDFYKISSDIAKETWVVGGMKDAISRSRSWKR